MNEPIRVDNQDFAIGMAITHCPASSVIYELVRNACENAVLLDGDPGKIEWFTEDVNGVPKLGLYNEGPGMSETDLERLMNIAATGKQIGLSKNYGQGAKLSGMKASPSGLTYRSCIGVGRAHEITLLMETPPDRDYPVCVKKAFDFDGERCCVIDVSEEMRAKGRELTRGWTEVILNGQNAEHDTVHGLFPDIQLKSSGEVRKRWLINLINQRFFRFPKNVSIGRSNIPTSEADNRPARGMEKQLEAFIERCESVHMRHPELGDATIRYIKFRGDGTEQAASHRKQTLRTSGLSNGDHVCLVFRNECFDCVFGWSRRAPAFGFLYGAGDFAVEILLPDDAPISMDAYRMKLVDRTAEASEVTCQHFAQLVKGARPQWIIDHLKQYEDTSGTRDLRDAVLKYLEQLKSAAPDTPLVQAPGDAEGTAPVGHRGDRGSNPGNGTSRADGEQQLRRRGTPTGQVVPSNTDARFVPASDAAWYEEMVGKAGEYVREENVVKLSETHPSYLMACEALRREWPEEAEYLRAVSILKNEYRLHAVKLVCRACFYRNSEGWGVNTWRDALTPEALTLHLTDPDFVKIVVIHKAKIAMAAAFSQGRTP